MKINAIFSHTILLLITTTLFTACEPQPKWLLFGALHGLDRQDWVDASYKKQLGTAGYYLLNLQRKGFLKSKDITEGSSFKVNANKLANCLNENFQYGFYQTQVLVAECVQTYNWNK